MTKARTASRLPNVFILGVGHSGTSIITQMLLGLGYRRNGCDTQYSEEARFRSIHEKLLALETGLEKPGGLSQAAILAECETLLSSLDKPFILKDPRFVMFAHLWAGIALAIDPHTVLLQVTRDVEENAESYTVRGEMVRGEPGIYGRTLDELARLSDEQFRNWPGPKFSFSYEAVRTAIAAFRLSAGARHMGGGIWEQPSADPAPLHTAAAAGAEMAPPAHATGAPGGEALFRHEAAELVAELRSACNDVARWRSDSGTALAALESALQANQELYRKLESNDALKARMALLKVDLEASNGLLAWYREKEASWSEEVSHMREEVAAAQRLREHWEEDQKVVSELYAQLTAFRASKLAGAASWFQGKDMLWEWVSPAFAEIKSYTERHFRRTSRTRLVLGADLTAVPYREYTIPYCLASLGSISLAVRPLQWSTDGSVGVEIVSSQQQVAAQVAVPLAEVRHDAVTKFNLPARLDDLGEPWWLRVFVRDVTVPVAVWELIRYSALGSKVEYLPFVLLE